MNAKQITIAVAGSGGKREFRDVSILPGTKARDVLGKLGLTDFQLSKPEGGALGPVCTHRSQALRVHCQRRAHSVRR